MMTIDTEGPLFRAGKQSAARLDKYRQNCRVSTSFLVLFYIRYRSYLRLLVPGCSPYYFPIDLSRHITIRKVCGQCRSFGNGHRLSSSGRAVSEDAASSADILRKLRMTSLPATSSDKVNNGSKLPEIAESISRLHLPLTTHRKKWHPLR